MPDPQFSEITVLNTDLRLLRKISKTDSYDFDDTSNKFKRLFDNGLIYHNYQYDMGIGRPDGTCSISDFGEGYLIYVKEKRFKFARLSTWEIIKLIISAFLGAGAWEIIKNYSIK